MWHATWKKLHSQQLPCGEYYATSVFWQGPETFFKQKNFAGIFSVFFARTKTKIASNYRDENHI